MAKSWSWSLALRSAVADQDSVDVPTPDYDERVSIPKPPSWRSATLSSMCLKKQRSSSMARTRPSPTLTGEDVAAGDTLCLR